MKTLLTMVAAVAVVAGGVACDSKDADKDKKADGGKKDKDKGKKDGGDKAAADAGQEKAPPKQEKPPAPPPLVAKDLPQTALTIELPESAKISEAIIAGADQINFDGVQAAMVVKPRLVTDKELPAMEEFAKGHQIQKFQKELHKEGEGKTYSYMYEVDMGGMKKVVFAQMFQIGDKDFMCFSNADNEDAAKAMKRSCDTVKAKA